MSKNHKHHAEKKVAEVTTNEAVVEPIEEIDTVVENPTPVEPEVEPVTEIVGTIVNCPKLNIRKKPDINAEIVCTRDAGCKLTIDLDKSTDEWYHVSFAPIGEGFCMKNFVTLTK